MDKVPKKKTVSVNFPCDWFSLLDFSTLVLKHRWGVSTLHCIFQKSTDLTRQFGDAGHGLALCGQIHGDLVRRFICEFKTTSQIWVPTLRKNIRVLHSSKYGNIIQVHIKHMKRLSLVWSPLTSTHSILY